MDGAETGGSPILDYRVLSNSGSGTIYTTLESNILASPYTATSLSVGVTYSFKVQARNEFGYSLDSLVVEILAAEVPSKPLAPVTSFNRETITVDWVAPSSQGSPILYYTVLFRESDLTTYSLELITCDGSTADRLSSTQCDVSTAVLNSAPYSLEFGSDVYVKVIATNLYGDSEESEAGHGTLMITYPDAPTNFVEDLSLRSASTIGFTWDEGSHNGGSSVTNYVLS